MKKFLSEKILAITKNKRKLENALNVKISSRGKEVFFEGSPEDEYYAEKIMEALEMGFGFEHAITIKTNEFDFEILNIKEYTPKKNFERIRGRIIGTGGKTLKVLSDLTDCYFELKDNKVGIIGDPEKIKNAMEGIILLVQGTKQSNVYSFLEKNRTKPIFDLGLKDK